MVRPRPSAHDDPGPQPERVGCKDALKLVERVPSDGRTLARSAGPIPDDPAFFRSLLQCSADSIAVVGRDGKIRFISGGLRSLGTTNVASMLGQQWLDLWPRACSEILADGLETALAGEPARRHIRCENDDGIASWWEICLSPSGGRPGPDEGDFVVAVARDVSDGNGAIENAELLARELNHRVRNMLSMVQAIIRISANSSKDLLSFIDSVEERIDALARTHSLLTEGRPGEAEIRAMCEAELAPFSDAGRVTLEGPSVTISDPSASALSLAIHELTTNAVKYGALSRRDGHVRVSWTKQADRPLTLSWIERGGPKNCRNERAGFGSMLLDHLLGDQLRCRREWPRAGLTATITLRAD